MWAFAIYDNLTQEIFISRDRFGIKPLYYWFSPDGTFCFGSEIKQFTCLPGWLAKINSPRVYDYLVYSITDHTDETMFKGVYQLPGGHCFKANIGSLETILGGKLVSVKWYDLKYKKFRGSFDEAAKHFNTLFKSAVDLHLRADVPVGSALSGGLDSSAIVCEVSNILKELGANHLQKTFSSCSTDERFDEKKWIDIVVAQTSVDAHFIYPKYEDVFKMISSLTWSHDEPYQSQSAFLGYHVFKSAAQNGVKVLLNGQGADEYLGGYSQFTISRYNRMFRRLKWRALFRDLKKSGEYKKVSYTSLLQNMLYATLPVGIKNWVAANFGSYTRAKGLISLKALGSLPSHPFNVIPARHRSVPEISRHMTLFSTLPKYLKWEDRNSMANSVEARVPFLDHRLVEFAYNMPDNFLENGWQTKLILREGLKDILPPEIKERKDKKGFITPEEKWVKEDAPILFREKFKEAIEQSNGIIKPEAIKYFDDILTGKIPFDFMYWRIIQFSEWRQLFNISN
jgi:asparagine synthase (glutamine-hydrolysing)